MLYIKCCLVSVFYVVGNVYIKIHIIIIIIYIYIIIVYFRLLATRGPRPEYLNLTEAGGTSGITTCVTASSTVVCILSDSSIQNLRSTTHRQNCHVL